MKIIAAEVVETGLRRDTKGRHIVPSEEREALIAEYQKSGLTQRAFAERAGVKYATFTSWLMGRRGNGRMPRPAFTELKLPVVTRQDMAVEVTLPSGLIVRGREAAEVALLVKALIPC